jgi:hypothetical protein
MTPAPCRTEYSWLLSHHSFVLSASPRCDKDITKPKPLSLIRDKLLAGLDPHPDRVRRPLKEPPGI